MKRLQRARAERGDELVGERLDGRVADGRAVAERVHVVADRVQQVGLAEAGRRVQEQRVVGLARELGDRERRGVREPVAVADDELVERVAGVELVAAGVEVIVGGGGVPWPWPASWRRLVERDARVGAEHRAGACVEDAREAPGDPAHVLGGAVSDSTVPCNDFTSSGASQIS